MLNDIIFQKQNGGLGRPAANEDGVSGLILTLKGLPSSPAVFNDFDVITVNGSSVYVARLSFYERLENELNVVEVPTPQTGDDFVANCLHYHVREFFRLSPTGALFLAVKENGNITASEIIALQNYAEGKIRQTGVADTDLVNLSNWQTAAAQLEADHQPLSIIATMERGNPALTVNALLNQNHVAPKRCNVSVLIGCDLQPDLVQKLGDDAGFGYFGAIGACLGTVSAAMVHECIAWVQKFPLGLTLPGLITGDLIKELPRQTLNDLNDERLIFPVTHTGIADSYWNDSHTLDDPTSDYAQIENVRTIDKAVRGIRAKMLPYLNAPAYVDAQSGKLRADTVAFLETVAQAPLDDMEKAGELSGYRAVIDPEQNILATSELEIIVNSVPVGVMRRIRVKIGFKTSLS